MPAVSQSKLSVTPAVPRDAKAISTRDRKPRHARTMAASRVPALLHSASASSSEAPEDKSEDKRSVVVSEKSTATAPIAVPTNPSAAVASPSLSDIHRMHVCHLTDSTGFEFSCAFKSVNVRLETTSNSGLLMAVLEEDLTVRGIDSASDDVISEMLQKGVEVPLRRLEGDDGQHNALANDNHEYRQDVAASTLSSVAPGHVRFFAPGANDRMRTPVEQGDGVKKTPGSRTIRKHIHGGDYGDIARCHIALWFALDLPIHHAETLAPLNH
jgi:hypothetical protein